jgi:hypothetical protein
MGIFDRFNKKEDESLIDLECTPSNLHNNVRVIMKDPKNKIVIRIKGSEINVHKRKVSR